MKLNYSFSNLIGTVFKKGNVLFTPDGDTLASPVGNKITFYNLKEHRSETLPVETLYDIVLIALDTLGNSLLAFDEKGQCDYISLVSGTLLHRHSFHKPIKAAQFSPNGKYFVVCRDTDALLFNVPGQHTGHYNPFMLERTFSLAHESILSMDWSADEKLFTVGASDLQIKVCATQRCKDFFVCNLTGHSSAVVGCFFDSKTYDIYSVDRQGNLICWKCLLKEESLVPATVDDEVLLGRSIRSKNETVENDNENKVAFYKRTNKFSMRNDVTGNNVKLVCADFNKTTSVLVTGHSNGAFVLHELPEFNLLHSLSVTDQVISSVSINSVGDWIAVASSTTGQLLVWEWQSETYVMKQQGHFYDMNCVAYSPDGLFIATGGQDSKVKIWTVSNGFCFVTFSEHSGSITGVAWTQGGKAVISCSLDGTVRAFDLKRYRNFRTFVSSQPVQFSCVCVDNAGDVVCAGGQDVFDIYVWSLTSGKLLDVLAGHEAPISSLHFNSLSSVLASGSWDKTIRIWDVFEGKGGKEIIHQNSDVLAVQFSPDGHTIACCTLDSHIYFYDWQNNQQIGSIEGRLDIDPGRGAEDEITAKKSGCSKAFTTVCYSPDGEYILTGGMSRNICIYHVEEQLLVKKFSVTCNRSLDYVSDDIDRRKMSEFGNLELVDASDSDEDAKHSKVKLPGVRKGDLGQRTHRPEIRIFGVTFSPTGRSWAVCTTEGLLTYSLDKALTFDPFRLEINITPQRIRGLIHSQEFYEALVMSLKLNDINVMTETVEKVPIDQIDFICRSLPIIYVEKLLTFLGGRQFTNTRHLQFYLIWISRLLFHQTANLKTRSSQIMDVLTSLQQVLTKKQQEIGKICEQNKFSLTYILSVRNSNTSIKSEILPSDSQKIISDVDDSSSESDLMDMSDFV